MVVLYRNSMFNFLRSCHTILQSKLTIGFSPQPCGGLAFSSRSHKQYLFSSSSYFFLSFSFDYVFIAYCVQGTMPRMGESKINLSLSPSSRNPPPKGHTVHLSLHFAQLFYLRCHILQNRNPNCKIHANKLNLFFT